MIGSILPWLLLHPVVTCLSIWVLIGFLPSARAAKVGAILGAAATYLLLVDLGRGRMLLVVNWFAHHTSVGIAGILVVFVGVGAASYAVAKTNPPTGDGVNGHPVLRSLAALVSGLLGFVGAGVVLVMVMFGLAWGSRGQVILVDSTIPPVQHVHGTYVALGDSYSAGEGLGGYADATKDGGNNCHDSPGAYGWLLGGKPGLSAPVLRACSGARSADIFSARLHSSTYADVPPQVFGNAVLNAGVGLVTITIGGNDAHFSDILQHCFKSESCMDATFAIPHPDLNDVGLPPPAPLTKWAEDALPVVQGRLEGVFTRIKSFAPNARIVVLGYPPLFPTGDRELTFSDCDTDLRLMDRGEREGLNRLQGKFNQAIYHAAVNARVEYIDPSGAYSEHEACGLFGGLINAPHLKSGGLDRGAFHPTALGQRVLARLVSCYLANYTAAPDPYEQRTIAGVTIQGPLKPPVGSSFGGPVGCS